MATEAIKKCKKCGERCLNIFERCDRFCINCGNKLPKAKEPGRCDCNVFIYDDDKFCTRCGKKVTKKKKITNKTKNGK